MLLTPSFGELYKAQLVDEGESLTVSDMTYLFTDLKQSTPLYESVGDVNAYFLVRQHFEILNKIIRERSGSIIKTIGDAVMAGFERPQDAVRASIEMIEELSRFNRTASRPLGLKVGVHRGRAIAVTLNDRIDYFGQDVNIAARVQGLADVNEVCISDGDGGAGCRRYRQFTLGIAQLREPEGYRSKNRSPSHSNHSDAYIDDRGAAARWRPTVPRRQTEIVRSGA